MGQFAGSVTAQWYDPTNGTYTTIGTFANSGTYTFNSPSSNSAGQNDFVLVLGGPLPQRTFAVPSAVSADAPPPLTIAELQSAYQILFNQHTSLQRTHIELQDRYLALLIMLDRENAPSEIITPTIN